MKPHHKTQNAFSHFFRRHASIVAFVGALIVFLTFVIKEGFREHLKDLSDSVSAAHIRFNTRDKFISISSKLDSIQSSFNIFRDSNATGHESGKSPSMGDELYSRQLLEDIMDLESQLDSCKELMVDIKASPELYERLTTVSNVMHGADMECRELNDRMNKFYQAEASEQKDLYWPFFESRSLTFDHRSTWRMSYYVFMIQVLKEADAHQHRSEDAYEICTWLSYGLYTLGWGLGLLGRLYKVEIPSGD